MKKIILTLAAFCFLVAASFGQEIEWQNTIGGDTTDMLSYSEQTSDGGHILGGFSSSDSSGDKTENSKGSTDYWVVKLDSALNIQWQKTIGGNLDDALLSLQQTLDGGYILGGKSTSDSSGDKTENTIGADYWVVKLDASGNIQWENTIQAYNSDWLYSVKQTSDGGYILGGQSNSILWGDKTEACQGLYDYWVVKLSPTGVIQWQNTIGGAEHDILHAIEQTSDGGYILGGYSSSNISGDKTENSLGEEDYWIVKLDPSGNIVWQNTIGGNDTDELNSLQLTVDGGCIISGSSVSDVSGDKTEASHGLYDFWIVKLNSSGVIEWQNTIGGTYTEVSCSIRQTLSGGYILGGWSNSNATGDKNEGCLGGYDFWVLLLDHRGNIQWQKTIGGSLSDDLNSVQQTADGGYFLGGFSYSNISGDKTENCLGAVDYWVVKLNENINRITGKCFADLNSNQIHDINEAVISNKSINELNTGRFAFSHPDGFYILTVQDSGNYSVSPASLNYYTAIPGNHTVYFSGTHQTDSSNDFAYQPSGVFNDLCVTITPMGNFRANMHANYMINYENVGTTTLNGTVIFFPDNDVTFVSSNPIATSITTDSVVWNVGALTPFQTGSISITVHVNNGTPAGTLIISSAAIEPIAGDANTACNYSAYEVFVTGSYDPNAILVDRDTVLTTELSSPPYLNYIIYFQNTGNDTAFTVKVVNPIDTFKLDIHSFEFVASSHPVNIEYKIWERNMEFTFDNILLPDSNVNEPGSHGFIRYRIKPKSTLIAGDEIHNTAFIYFDFNAPVQTNTVVTEIVLPTGEESFGSQVSGFRLYPNPARDELIVNAYSLAGKKGELKIYDLYGREVFQSSIFNLQSSIKIDVSDFSQGIYFVELQSGEQVLRGKFLKQ